MLTHLNANDIRVLSTCRVGGITPSSSFYDGLAGISIPGGLRPKLGNSSSLISMSVNDWWEQFVIARRPILLSRKVIVLTAANKDGGAHVDEELPDEYLQLIRGVWQKPSVDEPEFVSDHHFLCLRQMGYEILNSPELIQLASQHSLLSLEIISKMYLNWTWGKTR